MDTLNTPAEIAELKSLRQQNGWWRTGATIITVLWIGGCFISVNNSVQGLFQPGEKQTKFTTKLSENVQSTIVPDIQQRAAQTLTEARPEVEASFRKLNDRVPELTQASLAELQALQISLPASGQKILGETYGEMLAEKEAKIKQMFPDATEENIKALTDNMTELGKDKALSVNEKLFAKHQDSLLGIMESMDTIRASEPKVASSPNDNWELALAVMDVVRDDIKDLSSMAEKDQKVAMDNTKTAPPGAKPGAMDNKMSDDKTKMKAN